MKCLRTFTLFSFMTAFVILLTSAVPAGNSSEKPSKLQEASLAIDKAAVDGKLSYKELKAVAEDLKGGKLTLKEKIALKVFGKKIASKAAATPYAGGKSQLIALLLVVLVGGLGIHRFYLGYTWQGIVQLLTLGGCGIWALIDLIRIAMGTLKPKDGEYETTL